jgi:hypothetical protein
MAMQATLVAAVGQVHLKRLQLSATERREAQHIEQR